MPGFLLTKIAKSHPSKGKTNLCSETLTAPSTEALINLDTAKGVSVSPSILSLADGMLVIDALRVKWTSFSGDGPTRS